MKNLVLLSAAEYQRRLDRVLEIMRGQGVDTMIISDAANLYYLTGRVFRGWAAVNVSGTKYFVKAPNNLKGDGVEHIRKVEEIPAKLGTAGRLAFEVDTASYSAVCRLLSAFNTGEASNASGIMKSARAVKTDEEIELMRLSGVKQEHVYSRIPRLYREGMTDLELQIALENESRLQGCLGLFRVSGDSMEIYMGNLLTGKNADTPTPYDFAMGGAGINPSLPVGADGSIIERGKSVMVDMNGNFTGYMTDMTRCYSLGALPQLALDAHQCSVDICRWFEANARPGVAAKDLYAGIADIVAERGLESYFMGHSQHASFVGHGVGIEINELPVIAPKSREIVQEGNTIALEPKFVIPEVGAVGIENTYVIRKDKVECLTNATEALQDLA